MSGGGWKQTEKMTWITGIVFLSSYWSCSLASSLKGNNLQAPFEMQILKNKVRLFCHSRGACLSRKNLFKTARLSDSLQKNKNYDKEQKKFFFLYKRPCYLFVQCINLKKLKGNISFRKRCMIDIFTPSLASITDSSCCQQSEIIICNKTSQR